MKLKRLKLNLFIQLKTNLLNIYTFNGEGCIGKHNNKVS